MTFLFSFAIKIIDSDYYIIRYSFLSVFSYYLCMCNFLHNYTEDVCEKCQMLLVTFSLIYSHEKKQKISLISKCFIVSKRSKVNLVERFLYHR